MSSVSGPFAHVDTLCELGEGCVWDHRTQSLYWTDILQNTLYRLSSNDSQVEQMCLPHPLCSFGLSTDPTRLICAFAEGFALLNLSNLELKWIKKVTFPHNQMRMNDGKVSPNGHFWSGSMQTDKHSNAMDATLYTLTNHLQLESKLSGFKVSNGLCWSPCGHYMYHADTAKRMVNQYRYHNDIVSFDTTLYVFPEGQFPDGATVDSDGNLFVAVWGGSQVAVISPLGELKYTIPLPVSQPTCPTFGGKDLQTLYVTSARSGLTENQLAEQPLAGSVFAIPLPVKGIKATIASIPLT